MRNKIMITATGIVCLAFATIFAASGMCQYGGDTKGKLAADVPALVKVNNTVCPVTGNAIDMKNPVTAEYNGKIYNFCCAMCPPIFKANPEKYSKIAEEQAKKK